MRLVHLGSPVGLPSRQAHAVQITRMCEAFADSGLETRLLYAVPPEGGAPASPKAIFETFDLRPVFGLVPRRCLDLRRLLAKHMPGPWRAIRAVSYAASAWFYVLRHCNDEHTIIYSRERFASYLLLMTGRLVRARHVFESHTFLAERHGGLIIALFGKLDRLVTTTPFIAQRYVQAGLPESLVRTVANGVEPGRFQLAETQAECRARLGLPADRPLVGYVGNFRNTMGMEKGIPELLEAHARLLQRRTGQRPFLVCVGGPEDRLPGYRDLAGRIGLASEDYRFPGYAEKRDVPYWLKACDVLTIPWPDNEWAAYQTSPIKLFEYMASGVPIVASDLPSIREVLASGRNALLTPAGDPPGLAQAIARLLERPDEGARLAAQAREEVSGYSWARRVERVLEGIA